MNWRARACGLPQSVNPWGARYAWLLIWLGMRLEADDATRHRDRREPVPGDLLARCADLASAAGQLEMPSPSWSAYRDLVAAERSRAAGQDTQATWAAAVSAWENAEDAYPLCYSRLRLAEAPAAPGCPSPATASPRPARPGRDTRGQASRRP